MGSYTSYESSCGKKGFPRPPWIARKGWSHWIRRKLNGCTPSFIPNSPTNVSTAFRLLSTQLPRKESRLNQTLTTLGKLFSSLQPHREHVGHSLIQTLNYQSLLNKDLCSWSPMYKGSCMSPMYLYVPMTLTCTWVCPYHPSVLWRKKKSNEKTVASQTHVCKARAGL